MNLIFSPAEQSFPSGGRSIPWTPSPLLIRRFFFVRPFQLILSFRRLSPLLTLIYPFRVPFTIYIRSSTFPCPSLDPMSDFLVFIPAPLVALIVLHLSVAVSCPHPPPSPSSPEPFFCDSDSFPSLRLTADVFVRDFSPKNFLFL